MKRMLAALLCVSVLGTGCIYAENQAGQTESYYQLYFSVEDLDAAAGGDAIGTEVSTLRLDGEEDPLETAYALVGALLEGPASQTLKSPIPSGTQLLEVSVSGSHALVDLSSTYNALSGVSLTLADYCIALTLTQIPEIRAVSVTVRGQNLAYRDTQSFTARDVLLSSTEDVVGTVDVTLYFLNPEGTLSGEKQTLDLYEGDTQAEALVAALLAGPKEKDQTSALPEGFSVQSVWLDDHICYVNLLASTLEDLPEGNRLQTAIQALSRSLLSLGNVSEVRILVDGESADSYGGADISQPFSLG